MENETALPESLDSQLKQAAELNNELKAIDAERKGKQNKLDDLLQGIQATFDAMELTSLKAHGFTFYRKTRSSVTTPKTREEKEAFFKYLTERGIFWEMVGVNSQTLNKLYSDSLEEAEKEGKLEISIPGISEPKVSVTLEMKRS